LITCNQDILETTIKSKYFDKKKPRSTARLLKS